MPSELFYVILCTAHTDASAQWCVCVVPYTLYRNSHPLRGGMPESSALAKVLLVNCFVRGSKKSCAFRLCSITASQNTWLITPFISNGERVFSVP